MKIEKSTIESVYTYLWSIMDEENKNGKSFADYDTNTREYNGRLFSARQYSVIERAKASGLSDDTISFFAQPRFSAAKMNILACLAQSEINIHALCDIHRHFNDEQFAALAAIGMLGKDMEEFAIPNLSAELMRYFAVSDGTGNVPDSLIPMEDMFAYYGYHGRMLPIPRATAYDLFGTAAVYNLYDDGTEDLIEDKEHLFWEDDSRFGIKTNDWRLLSWDLLHEIMSKRNYTRHDSDTWWETECAQRFSDFISGSSDAFAIFHLSNLAENEHFAHESYDYFIQNGFRPNCSQYDCMYVGAYQGEDFNTLSEKCVIKNASVVAVRKDGNISYYFADQNTFREIADFTQGFSVDKEPDKALYRMDDRYVFLHLDSYGFATDYEVYDLSGRLVHQHAYTGTDYGVISRHVIEELSSMHGYVRGNITEHTDIVEQSPEQMRRFMEKADNVNRIIKEFEEMTSASFSSVSANLDSDFVTAYGTTQVKNRVREHVEAIIRSNHLPVQIAFLQVVGQTEGNVNVVVEYAPVPGARDIPTEKQMSDILDTQPCTLGIAAINIDMICPNQTGHIEDYLVAITHRQTPEIEKNENIKNAHAPEKSGYGR